MKLSICKVIVFNIYIFFINMTAEKVCRYVYKQAVPSHPTKDQLIIRIGWILISELIKNWEASFVGRNFKHNLEIFSA